MRHGSHTEVIISYSLFQVFFTASDLIIRPLRQQDRDWFWSFVGLHAGSPYGRQCWRSKLFLSTLRKR